MYGFKGHPSAAIIAKITTGMKIMVIIFESEKFCKFALTQLFPNVIR
jgi:hypothetical protein